MTEVATFSGGPASPPPDTGTNAFWTGSVVTSYNGEVTTVRDQAGKQRRSTVDGLGRLKSVEEMMEWPSTVVYATTSYSYDARGNLKQVNQGSQVRTFSYDGLSRLLTATNPESGSVSYSYDLNSNLLTKTDARPVTTTYTYDELNRVTLRNYSDTTPDVSYVYDPPIQNGKGRLASVTSSVSGYNYTAFDAMGRVTAYNQQTAGQLYTMSATYNKGGLMTTETYPSRKVIETQYDGAGRIAGVKKQSASGFIAGGASSDATNRLQYTAHGGVSVMKLGNGLWEHVNFNSRLQPTQIGLGVSSTSTSVLGLDYGYGTTTNNGNVMSQTITAPGLNVTQSYSYDQVNRLSNATETAASGQTWQQIYGYDVYGNRWVSSGYKPNPTLTPQSQSAFSAANNRIVLAGFNYDLVGNLTSDPTTALNAMVYDAENRQVSYTKASVTTSYAYDGDGRRVKKVDSTGTTVFVYNASGQLVAEYTDVNQSGTVAMSYLTADHLGSTRLVTDASGSVKARHDYLPFGEEIETGIGGRSSVTGYTAVDSTRQRFTSKERDQESGLDYFGARYYSSAQGRFTGVDPISIKRDRLRDPQRLNLYVYVRNNPLAFYDPDGRDLRAGTSKDQAKIKKTLVEIAKREEGRKFLNGLNDKPIDIYVNVGTGLKDQNGRPAYGSVKGGEIIRSKSTGDVLRGDPITVTVDFNKASQDRQENKASKELGGPVIHENVPESDTQLQGHELAHVESQLNRTPDTEATADARINEILSQPVDKNLEKDAEKYVDNLLKPKDQEQKPNQERKKP
jgi:RHS repeat-associated protein